MLETPKRYSLVAGTGEALTALTAFDAALLDSGLGNLNLLKVSSILPPGCEHVEKPDIPPGALTPTAFASITSHIEGEIISAAVAVGVPQEDTFGVIMECSGNWPKEEIERRITSMIIEAFERRGMALKEIRVAAASHKVERCGCAFAGVALWY
jgi:arginine decarboxylase